jgi:hypothetical protein
MKAKSGILLLSTIALLWGAGDVFAMGAKGDRMAGKDTSTMTNDQGSMEKHGGKMMEQDGTMGTMKEEGTMKKDEGMMKKDEGMMKKDEGMKDHTSKGMGNGAMDKMDKNDMKTDTMK